MAEAKSRSVFQRVAALPRLDRGPWIASHAGIGAGILVSAILAWLFAHGHYRLPLLVGVTLWYVLGDLRKVFVSSIILIAVAPIIVVGQTTGWRADEYLLPVLLVRWVMWASRHSEGRHASKLATPVAIYILALWVSATASALSGSTVSPHADPLRYLFTLAKPLEWVAWFLVAQQFLHDPRVQRWSVTAAATALLAVCAIGIVQYLDIAGMRGIVREMYPPLTPPADQQLSLLLGEKRATSTFTQPNWFASFIAGGIPLLFALAASLRPAGRLGLLMIAAPVVSLGLCYSGSRGGMLAAAFGLAVLGALQLSRRRSTAGPIIVAMLAVAAILLAPRFASPQQRAYALTANRYPTSAWFVQSVLADPRLPGWLYYAGVFSTHPVFGDGAAETVDNQYLFVLARYGLVGFAAFVPLIVGLLRSGWIAWRRHPIGLGQEMAGAALAGMLAVLVNGMTDVPLQTHRTMELFWLLAALSAALAPTSHRRRVGLRRHPRIRWKDARAVARPA